MMSRMPSPTRRGGRMDAARNTGEEDDGAGDGVRAENAVWPLGEARRLGERIRESRSPRDYNRMGQSSARR